MSRVVFREVQKFRQTWVWVLVLGILGPLVVLFGSGLVQQLGSGRPWGNRPMSDGGLIIASLITALVILIAGAWWFYTRAI